jgi:UDP-N-acetylmuramate--alanine ligase
LAATYTTPFIVTSATNALHQSDANNDKPKGTRYNNGMHVYFSGIGGAGIGPLALIAHQAGYTVSGSDKQQSSYIEYLQKHGLTDIHIGQSYDEIAAVHAEQPIDWYVYSSAIAKEQADAPELRFCKEQGIKATKRDEFLSQFITDNKLKMIAIAGTHGKTTTTAMAVWLFKRLGIPISYSVGAKLSFGEMGEYVLGSEYFVYEADEFDHNFLAFHPYMSIITGVDWDHPDIYPTREEYDAAFHTFLNQNQQAMLWKGDVNRLRLNVNETQHVLDETDPAIDTMLRLPGKVNRQDAWIVAQTAASITSKPIGELLTHLNQFPGVSRRFEKLANNVYSDYAHTPPKIQGALQLAHEIAGDNVVVVYEGLHNTRQHFIKDDLKHLFDDVKQLYVVPSYLAREDPNLAILDPADIIALGSEKTRAHAKPAALDDQLLASIRRHTEAGDLVLCLTAGGGGSLDEWLRAAFAV